MKLSLLSTWTGQKILTLFLTVFSQIQRTEEGQAFRNCLEFDRNDIISYDSLLKFSFSEVDIANGKKARLYCNRNNCSTTTANTLSPSFDCSKIGQTIFCENIWCGGIVGDIMINSNTTTGSYCANYDFNTIINHVKTSILLQREMNNGYLSTFVCSNTSSSSYCSDVECFWDNGGWTCANNDAIINVPSDYSGNCFLQWPTEWPGPTDKNPLLSITTTSSKSLVTNNPTSTSVITQVVESKEISKGIPAWEIATISLSSILGTVLTSFGIWFCWTKRVITIPTPGGTM